jgi:hypothetical protein
LSFINREELLELFQPLDLMRLTGKLINLLNDAVRDRISELAGSADPDSDLDDHFDQISAFLRERITQ